MTRAVLPGRRLVPGSWRADGARPALAACTGSCDQGRAPCDCTAMPRPVLRPVLHPDLHRITLTELDLELSHDDKRVIAPPRHRQALPDPMKRRRVSRALATAAAALIAFGVLLMCSAHQAHAQPAAAVFVGRP